ncbi:MAG: proline iminopeptidase [Elusimicrobia bacterium CG_4_10_14_0_2_um_filter_56_8]|nr:MAG: proline iminopeptidase [Elusimicrobia bacterium CG_4_10_14_0_2_um_filter_56_8]
MKSKIISHIEEQGYMRRGIGRTFFRRLSPANARKGTPLFILHGGPGATHETYYEILSLADDREVVIYDQVGCGRSDRIKGKYWAIKTFVQELEALRVALGHGKIDLLGHSWGSMLASEYYFSYPKNVRGIVFSSSCLDAKQWTTDAQRLIKQLPARHQKAIATALRTKKYDGKAFKAANKAYGEKYIVRNVGKGAHPQHAIKLMAAGLAVDGYMKMWGPTEYIATGLLRKFNRAKDLPGIRVPTLFTCGRYDEATPETIRKHASIVPGAKFHVFEKSSHLCTLEEPREYVKIIGGFLRQVDKQNMGDKGR